MDLRTLNASYGDFYVPGFTVKAGGQDLVRELFLTVTSVEIDLKEKAAAHFTIAIAGAFDWQSRQFVAHKKEERVDLLDLFVFGRSIEISLGYGEPSRLKPIVKGIVTEIATGFSAGGSPELKISGFDNLYKLGTGKNTYHWEESYDSDAVQDLASKLKVSTDIVTTGLKKPRIDQNEESDLAFIEKLAGRNKNTIFYLRDDRFYFGPRHNERKDVLELVWGEGLLSFSPQVSLAKQITEVAVYGWSAENGEVIVGKARRGEEEGRDGGQSGGERLAKALDAPSPMKVRMAVRSQDEADARAKAILDERALDYVTGDGECIGLPDIVPDINISLGGLGKGFTKIYYVSEATHKLDSSGYRTTFKVQEPTV
jgi:phage protein D